MATKKENFVKQANPYVFLFSRKVLRIFAFPLCFSFLFPPQFILASTLSKMPSDFPSQVKQQAEAPALAFMQAFPFYDELVNSPELPKLPHVSAEDPILDHDPLFTYSQDWEQSSGVASLEFEKTHKGFLKIHLGKNLSSFVLEQKLTPQLQTTEFIILSADTESMLFNERSEAGNAEGLFFIDTLELTRASRVKGLVYVYYLPLNQEGWQGDLQAESFGNEQFVVQAQSGETALIDISDLRRIRDQSRVNALLGARLAAYDYGKRSHLQNGELLRPARGSTKAFGLVYSGVNLDNPSQSKTEVSSIGRFFKPLKNLCELALPQAFANAPSPEAFELLMNKIEGLSYLLGSALVLSLGAKYAIKSLKTKIERNRVLRDEAKEAKEELKRSKEEKTPTTIFGLAWQDFRERYIEPSKTLVKIATPEIIKQSWREFVEASDVLVHGLYANWQIPTVLFSDLVEFTQDRWAASFTAADNTLVRRIQNYTIYFTRRINLDGKVNARTLALAGLLMGAVGTASSYIQMTWVLPAIAAGMAPYLWETAQLKLEQKFSTSATTDYVVNNAYRTFYAWMMGGPSGFSADTRSQIEIFLKSEIENHMRNEGKNPRAPEHRAEYETLFKKRLDEMMGILGLPRDKEFLFDLKTIEKWVYRKLGYTGDKTRPIEDITRSTYLGENRPGLVKGSIDRALKMAQKRLATVSESDDAKFKSDRQKALDILVDIKLGLQNTDANQSPADQIRTRNTLKHVLTALTFTGPPFANLEEHTPKEWIEKYGRAAALEAAYIYRKAFLSLLFGEKELLEIQASTLEKHETAARESARLKREEQKLTRTEEEQLFEAYIYEMVSKEKAATEANEFTPFINDAYAEKQRLRAERKTLIEVEQIKAQQEAIGEAPVVSVKTFQEIYARHFAYEVGIHLLPDDDRLDDDIKKLYEQAHQKAQELTKDELQRNTGFQSYLQNLANDSDRELFLAYRYSRNFLQTYKELTVDTNTIRAHSPAQPGVTQKIRQSDVAQKSKVLTALLRFSDSFFGTEVGYKPGKLAWFYRNWPNFLGGYDFTSSIERTLRFAPSIMFFRWPYLMAYGMFFPVETYLLITAFNFMYLFPTQWVKRISTQNNMQPTGSAPSAAAYSLVYTWSSMLGNFPIMLLDPNAKVAEPSDGSSTSTRDIPKALCETNLKK